MHNTLLQNKHIMILLFSESLVFVMLCFAFVWAVVLFFRFDFKKYDARQYAMERKAWLVVTIVVFAVIVKLLLFAYLVFTIDSLSGIVPGAMCAAGVISFNDYGMMLLYLKMAVLFGFGFWMILNYEDLQSGNYPWFKQKMLLYIVMFLFTSVELFYEFSFFNAIDIHKVINCCSTLYGLLEGMNPLPYGFDKTELIVVFSLSYLLVLSSFKGAQNRVLLFALLLFAQLAYYIVLYVTGPYIYQQPNHNCPFCMLQREYYHIGYIVWGLLYGGVFCGIGGVLSEELLNRDKTGLKKLMVLLLSMFIVVSVLYVAYYYFTNGVFLDDTPVDTMPGMDM